MTVGLRAASYTAQLAGRNPSAPAVVHRAGTWTTEELWARGAAAADWLDALGVPRGEARDGPDSFRPRVTGVPTKSPDFEGWFRGIPPRDGPIVPAICASGPDALALFAGALGSGRVLAPLGSRLTARELTACIDGLDADVIVADADVAGTARGVAAEAGCRLAVLPDFGRSGRPLEFDAGPDELALVLHTGGTTGLPKRVDVRQDRLAERVRVNSALMGFDGESVYATATGFHHIAGIGMFVAALGSGGAVAPYPRFSLEAWRSLEGLGVTHALIVPTMIELLLREGALRSRHVRVLQYGSAPIHPDTLRATIEALPGVALVQMFGQTEGSPISVLGPEDHRLAASGRADLLRSVGRAAPGVELRLEERDEVGVGEILARAEHLFKVDAEGWLHSGDLGRMDSDGYLYLVGRRGDRIIRGGENVYPVEVEEVLARHPAVREVAVVGVPDRYWGEVVKAVLVVDPVRRPSEDELRTFCRRELSGIKVPTLWEFRAELPRSLQGKVLRRLLRD